MYGLGSNPDGVTGMNVLSISNIENNSPVLWATLVCLYFETLVVFYVCLHHYAHAWRLRNEFVAQRSKELRLEEFTVLVTRIPRPEDVERHNKWWGGQRGRDGEHLPHAVSAFHLKASALCGMNGWRMPSSGWYMENAGTLHFFL